MLAKLSNVSFKSKTSFEELTDESILKFIENKVEFIPFNGTLEMYKISSNILNPNNECQKEIDIENCYYDDKYLIQSFTIDNEDEKIHNEIIFVKRKILPNDTYTFLEYDENNNESDIYQYENMEMNDVINIIRNKSMIKGVYIDYNGNIMNENIIIGNQNEDVGKFLLKNKNMEIMYLNISNINNKVSTENVNEKDKERMVMEKINAYCAKHIFLQIDINLGILNCCYESFAENKNELLTKLFNIDIYGDAILFLQKNDEHDKDVEYILDLNKELFEGIYDIITTNKRQSRDNINFFNIYREVLRK